MLKVQLTLEQQHHIVHLPLPAFQKGKDDQQDGEDLQTGRCYIVAQSAAVLYHFTLFWWEFVTGEYLLVPRRGEKVNEQENGKNLDEGRTEINTERHTHGGRDEMSSL